MVTLRGEEEASKLFSYPSMDWAKGESIKRMRCDIIMLHSRHPRLALVVRELGDVMLLDYCVHLSHSIAAFRKSSTVELQRDTQGVDGGSKRSTADAR